MTMNFCPQMSKRLPPFASPVRACLDIATSASCAAGVDVQLFEMMPTRRALPFEWPVASGAKEPRVVEIARRRGSSKPAAED